MGRGILPQILNCHVPCKKETAKNKGTQHTVKDYGDQKQQKKVGILSKKEGNPGEIKKKRGSYENLRKPELLTRGLQATHELGGLNVEV